MNPVDHPALGQPVRVEYSARHVHLSQADQDVLFGPGYRMTPLKELSQAGQYAYEETVIVKGKKGQAEARVLGPCRARTQVELAASDAFKLGIETPVRVSGDVADTGACELIGPKGTVDLEAGVINDRRHLHVSDQEAETLGLKQGDLISVRLPGQAPITVHGVVVRVDPSFHRNVHIDIDEADAASLTEQGLTGEIVEVSPKSV